MLTRIGLKILQSILPKIVTNWFELFPICFPGFGGNGIDRNDPWQQSAPSNMAMIKDLQVQCEKDMMRVRILFDRPFYGMVFSKGHYSNVNCVHVPSGLGQTQVRYFCTAQFVYLKRFWQKLTVLIFSSLLIFFK